MVLSAIPTSVQSDNSDTSTITATVLDAGNAAVANATVLFSASGGVLGAASVVSDANGAATVTFSAGVDQVNQVVTITATLAGVTPAVSAQIPVRIVGSTVALTTVNTNITDNGSITDTLTVTVKDAGNNPINNTPVTFSQTGTGAVTITPLSATTDSNGQVTATITGVTAGNVTVTVDAAGATASQAYNVATTGTAFGITAPVTDPYALSAATPLTVTVNAPGVTTVTFATSMGLWNGVSSVLDVAVTGNSATATFTSPTAGTATVQVFDKANPATLDTMTIAVSQQASAAAQIALQSNVNVVAPSTGGVVNIATLTATVRDASGQVVGGAPVYFTIPSPTGGGEFVSPVIAFTDSLGKAQTTFTSGSIGSGAQGVDIYANVLSPPVGPAISNIVIGGTAGSVVIGRGTTIQDLNNSTAYGLPMSVLVADSNGNPVANAVVSLKVWPKFYHFGFWYSQSANSDCVPIHHPTSAGVTAVPNEDLNRNTLLDPGEDLSLAVSSLAVSFDSYGNIIAVPGAPYTTLANDAALTPGISAGGTVPATVTTDANGVATFDLIYLKSEAAWITDEITASTQVLGTETTGKIEFTLGYSASDASACLLSASPFNESTWPD